MRTFLCTSLALLPILPACQRSAADFLPRSPDPEPNLQPSGSAEHPQPAPSLEALAAELEEMMRLDQLHRTPVSWGTQDEAELARLEALDDEAHMEETKRRWREGVKLPEEVARALMDKQAELDRANFARLIELIKEYGYPDPERLGIDAPTVVPVLIHADPEDYVAQQDLFREEALAGRMPAKEYAALTDRKLQHFGQVQLYGTSSAYDPKSNTILPPEIEDIEVTNRARRELGLEPLDQYRLVNEG